MDTALTHSSKSKNLFTKLWAASGASNLADGLVTSMGAIGGIIVAIAMQPIVNNRTIEQVKGQPASGEAN